MTEPLVQRPIPVVTRIRPILGRARRELRALRDNALHGWRRRRARARLGRMRRPGSVLFVCLGNVCRSPYAAHRFRRLAAGRGAEALRVDSVGFIGPGRPPAERALEEALARDVDTSEHRSRVVTRDDVAEADLVVVVDPGHRRRLRRTVGDHGIPVLVLGDLDPGPIRHRTIRDPWGNEPAVYQRVFDRLDRCLGELADLLFRDGTG